MVRRLRIWEAEQQKQSAYACSDLSSTTHASPAMLPSRAVVPTRGVQRPRQLIVAVTANGAECGECGDDGFDEICPKPLTKTDIHRIVSRFFQ